MKPALRALVFAATVGLMIPAAAQTNEPSPPVEKAAYHWPIFKNELTSVLRVYIPPERASDFHVHSFDQINVTIEDGAFAGQEFGKEPLAARSVIKGAVTFNGYSQKSLNHRVTTPRGGIFHSVVVGLLKPSGLAPTSRSEPYKELFNNERARGWKLTLEPGESVGPISQLAPGLRVVIDGGEIAEVTTGNHHRGLALRIGDVYWQEPGSTRGVENTGATRIEIVEFEFK